MHFSTVKLTLLLAAWGVSLASAKPGPESGQRATVLEVGKFNSLLLISNPGLDLVRVNDVLCLRAVKKTTVCGQVIQVTNTAILFAPSKQRAKVLAISDTVEVLKRKRSLAGTSRTLAMVQNREVDIDHKTSLSVGLNVLQPFLHFDQAVSPQVTLGIMPLLLSASPGNATLSGTGGFGTFTFYPRKAFEGIWLLGGAGLYLFRATVGATQESTSSLAGLGLLGYRWVFESKLHLGIAGGGQYLFNTKLNTVNSRFSGFLPCAVLELGWVFY